MIKFNSKLMLAKVIGIGLVVLLVVLMVTKRGKKEGEAGEIKVEQQNTTYDSKLKAYKSKHKQDKEAQNKQQYNSKMDRYVGDTVLKQEPKIVFKQVVSSGGASKRKESNYASIDRLEQVTGRTPRDIIKENSEESQEELEKEFRQQQQVQDEKEEKRKAMQGWNKEKQPSVNGNGYRAVIHGTQQVSSGKTAVFRTKEEINISGIKIPQNTLLSGVVGVSNNRLNVSITTIRLGSNIYSVSLAVYGSDGLIGIPTQMQNVRNTANREITNEAASTVRRRGGIVGEVVGTVMKGVSREKEQEVQLIDNQTIFLKTK